MKTIKELFEVYKPKSPDEQKFVDKHVTIKHKDRNGNDDDVFNGSNVKTVKRKEERHGYDVGEDEKVYESVCAYDKSGKMVGHYKDMVTAKKLKPGHRYEIQEAEDLDELSNKTLSNYITKGSRNLTGHAVDAGHEYEKGNEPKRQWRKIDNREQGIKRAVNKLTKEEAEELDEISAMTKDAYAQKAGKQLTGLFKKSGSDADAARKYYNRKNTVRKIANEEAEDLDELSKGTLSSYVIKATHPSRENSISNLASKGGFKNATSLVGSDDDRDPNKNGEKEDSKSAKRSLGVIRAVSKLTKEDIINRTIEKYITPDMPTPLTMEERLVTKIVDLSESHIYLLLDLFESLSEDNKMRMLEQVETPEGVTELLDFAIENRGV